MSERAIRDKRDQTQAHYDKYPFRFDQRAIVDEKMENRLMGAALRKPMGIPIEISWNLFHDQFTTPNCTFHTFEEVSAWAEEAGLVCAEKKREAANQLISFRLQKPIQ